MVLEVRELEKTYKQKKVLEDVSFTIEQGEVIGLVGPNGAGKSTLMRSILGLEEINKGSVKIKEWTPQDPNFFKYISFLPSDNYLYMQLSGYDHLAFIANTYDLPQEDVDQVVTLIGIESYVHHPVKSYSYGMRQHLLIAISILTKPLIILMDEPFNGLDPTSIIELKQLIRTLNNQGMSIVISTHNLDVLEDLTNKVWFIKDGHLVTNDLVASGAMTYELKLSYSEDIDTLMSPSGLPYSVKDNNVITDASVGMEKYLEWLLNHDVYIQSVNPINRKLEELYREFYEV